MLKNESETLKLALFEQNLIDKDGFITEFGLKEGFSQKNEVVLSEENNVGFGLFTGKKMVSANIFFDKNESKYIIIHINDIVKQSKTLVTEEYEKAKFAYNEFSKLVDAQNWLELNKKITNQKLH